MSRERVDLAHLPRREHLQHHHHQQYYIGQDNATGTGSLLPNRISNTGAGPITQNLITVTPNSIIPSTHEEALPLRRKSSTSLEIPSQNLDPVFWETMTDDEREEIHRQKRKEEAYKTALCDAYKKGGQCPYGQGCRFAHGENELRLPSHPRGKTHPKYKTQLCDKFSNHGHCPYGPRCQFIHKLKKGLPLMKYERLLSNGDISPAREDELMERMERRSTDTSPVRNGLRNRLSSYDAVLPGSEGWSSNEHLDGRRSIEDGRSCVYPKMEVINVERAYKIAEEARERERYYANKPDRQERRRNNDRIEHQQGRLSLPMAAPMERAASMQSLAFRGPSPHYNAPYYKQGQMYKTEQGRPKPRPRDLSLIREEAEEYMDNSQVRTQTGRPSWTDLLFGRSAVPSFPEKEQSDIVEETSEDLDEARLESNLLVQSCDEELLAGALYDYKYQDPPTDLIKEWKALNLH